MSNEILLQSQSIERINASSFIESRRDLRYRTALTFAYDAVSPVQCAFSLRSENGRSLLELHVSDVSELICPATPIDDEARRRGAGVDTDHGRSEMLPNNLIWNTFNLKEGEDRLALSVLLDIGPDGELVSIDFDETVIRVDRRCLFDELDAMLISNDASAVLSLRDKYRQFLPQIDAMYSLSALLRRKRFERGGLQIDKFYREFTYNDNAEVNGFKRVAQSDSEAMLFEFTLFASAELGKYLANKGYPAIFVGNEPPNQADISALANAVGVKVDTSAPEKAANELVDLCRGADCHGTVCDELCFATPCRKFSPQPIYECIAAADAVVLFNRPATRYSDILFQRLLKTVLKKGDEAAAALKSQAEFYAEVADKAELARTEAERSLDRSRLAALLTDGAVFEGWVYSDNTVILENNARLTTDEKLEYGKKYMFKVKNGKAVIK